MGDAVASELLEWKEEGQLTSSVASAELHPDHACLAFPEGRGFYRPMLSASGSVELVIATCQVNCNVKNCLGHRGQSG